MEGKLILIATPIGNLKDISQRALDEMSSADFIAAEDTRVTAKLLNHFEIKKPLTSYHEHNMDDKGFKILNKIKEGNTCVLVSDAGMPAISDPGEKLVSLCAEAGIQVSIIPGACAAVSALAISGLNTSRFVFEGFLTVNKKNRRSRLEELKFEKRTLIFYEAPHKLMKTLKDMYDFFGDRKIALVRELTKIHEEVIRTTLKESLNIYTGDNKPKGEFVIIVQGNKLIEKEYTLYEAVDMASMFIEEGDTKSLACKKVAKITGFGKSEIYSKIASQK